MRINTASNSRSVEAMKRRMSAAVLAVPAVMALAAPALAANRWWDPFNGSTTGVGISIPTGTWDTSTPNWSSNAGGTAPTTWAAGDAAFFSAGADGTGTFGVTVAGTQNVSGGLTIEEGFVNIMSGTLAVGAGTVTVNNGATLSIDSITRITQSAGGGGLVLNGGTIRSSAGSGGSFWTSNGNMSLGAAGTGTIESAGSGARIYRGALLGTAGSTTANGGGGSYTKTGAGEFRYEGALTASTTFSRLVVNEGLFRIGNGQAGSTELGFGAAPTAPTADAITLNGGAIGTSLTLTLHANRGITIGASGGTFDMGAASMTVSGAVTGAAGGSVNITGGQALRLNALNIDGNLNHAGTGTLTLAEGGTAAGLTGAGPVAVLSGKTLTADGAGTTTYGGVVSGAGQFTRSGGGTTVLLKEWTNTGATNITDGTLRFNVSAAGLGNSSQVNIGAGGTLDMNGVNDTIGSLAGAGSIVDGGNLTLTGNNGSTASFSGSYAGTGALTKNGTGIQTLSGSNGFTSVNFNDGRINFNNNNAAGSGTIAVAANADEFVSTANGIVLANALTVAGTNTLFYATAGNSLRLDGEITGAGGILRDNTGAGTLTLAGNSSFAGGVKVTSRGLVVGGTNALGAGTLTIGDAVTAPANAIILSSATDLTGAAAPTNAVAVNQNFTVGGSSGFALAGDMTLAGASRTITVSNTGGTSFDGIVSGSAALTKAGDASLALTNANAYAGGTTVAAGTLVADNGTNGKATGSGLVKVDALSILTTTTGGTVGSVDVAGGAVISAAPGAVLVVDGDATIAGTAIGNIVVNGDVAVTGTLAPGNSPGVFEVGGDLALSGIADMELAGATPGSYDEVRSGGLLTFGGTLNVLLLGSFVPVPGQVFDLFDFAAAAGTFAQINLPALASGNWDLSDLYRTGELSVVDPAGPVVPLPSSALAGLGLLGGLGAARRVRGTRNS
jgi:autotransporter-associated beta strand protein